MPDVSLNGISFEIKGSTDEASKSIDELQNKLESLRGALSSTASSAKKSGKANPAGPLTEGLQELINKADKIELLKMKLDLLKESLANAFTKGDLAGAIRFKEQIINTTASVQKLQEAAAKANEKAMAPPVQPVSQEMQDMIENANKVDLLKMKLEGLKSALQTAFQNGDKQGAMSLRGQILSTEEAIKRIEDAANKSKLEAYQKRVEATQERLKKLGDVAKKAGKNLTNVIAGPLISGAKGAKDFAGGISKTIGGFKRILGYRIIRSVIKEITQGFQEGIKNLYGWSALVGGEFKTSMDSIATDMQYLKNSIAAAAAPIINALAPAIEFLTDKIVGLINIINQLFAKLTGATYWTRAKRKADEYGDAVSGAGAAAKEALKYLAPFDELNRLPDDRGGRGSGGNQEDYSDMFEDVTEFNEGISNFADMIREKVNAGDWQGLGTLLGEKVNDVINMIDFAGLGAKVGTGINAWFTTKYWTFETINFTNIGSKIAEFLNNMMSNVDFDIIGRSITQRLTNLGDLIIGAVRDINWTNVGSSISSVISGAFNQISDWLSGVDWSEVGTDFYNMLKNTLDGIDFGAIASSVFQLLGSALSAAVTFLASVISNVVTDIKDYFLQYIQDENGDGNFGAGEIISGICQGIVNAVKNIGSWIKTNIFDPFITGFKNAFGIHSPATEMEGPGEMIGEGILQGLLKPFQNIKQWIQEHIVDPIKEKLQGFSLSDLLTGSGDSGGTSGSVSLDVEAVITNVKDGIDSAKKTLDNFKANIATAADNIKTKVSNGWKATIASATDNIKDKVSNAWKAVFGSKDSKKIDGSSISATASMTGYDLNFGSGTLNNNKKTPLLSSTAQFNGYNLNFGTGTLKNNKVTPLLSSTAQFNGYNLNFGTGTLKNNKVTPLLSSTAQFNGYALNFGSGTLNNNKATPLLSSTANLNNYANNVKTPWINSTANLTDYYDNLDNPTVNVTANILDYETNNPGYVMGGYAKGGTYYGGSWHDIPQAASGGKFHGTMFWAGENGPEVVGHAGGRTEVLNRSQIAATMYAAVSSALSGIQMRVTGMGAAPMTGAGDESMSEDVLYRAMLRALNDSDNDRPIELDGDIVYRKMVNRNRANTRVTGVNALAG